VRITVHAVRRSLYLITLGSWLTSPLALALAQFAGFSNSKQVLAYLFILAIQAPFLILLNESLAPALMRRKQDNITSLIPIVAILLSLFVTTIVSLTQIKVLNFSMQQAIISAFVAVISALISYFSSHHVLKHISLINKGLISITKLTLIGALPSTVVLGVFSIYALIKDSFFNSQLELLIPALLLPNILHYTLSKKIFNNTLVDVTDGNSVALPLFNRGLLIIFFACVALPFNVTWGNALREEIGAIGSMGWIILITNMLFSIALVLSKSKFIENGYLGKEGISKINSKKNIFIFIILVLLAFFNDNIFSRIALLLISFAITIILVTQCRSIIYKAYFLTNYEREFL
jgi:hypothetical protein